VTNDRIATGPFVTVKTASPVRRSLRFESPQAVLAEAEQLASGSYQLAGKWTYGQILDHLARGIDNFYVGFGFQAPWIARTLIASFFKKRTLTKGMPAGFQLPKSAASLLPPPGVSTEEGLQRLQTAINRLIREEPSHPHPFFGKLTPDEVRQLMLRHAELHLSFVILE
jgi:hypothetical protein